MFRKFLPTLNASGCLKAATHTISDKDWAAIRISADKGRKSKNVAGFGVVGSTTFAPLGLACPTGPFFYDGLENGQSPGLDTPDETDNGKDFSEIFFEIFRNNFQDFSKYVSKFSEKIPDVIQNITRNFFLGSIFRNYLKYILLENFQS